MIYYPLALDISYLLVKLRFVSSRWDFFWALQLFETWFVTF